MSGAAHGDVCHGFIYTHSPKSNGSLAICLLVKTVCNVGRFIAYTYLPVLFLIILIFNDS